MLLNLKIKFKVNSHVILKFFLSVTQLNKILAMFLPFRANSCLILTWNNALDGLCLNYKSSRGVKAVQSGLFKYLASQFQNDLFWNL